MASGAYKTSVARSIASSREDALYAPNFMHQAVDGDGVVIGSTTHPHRIGRKVMHREWRGETVVTIWDECPYCRGGDEPCHPRGGEWVAQTYKGEGWEHGSDGRLYNRNVGSPKADGGAASSLLPTSVWVVGLIAAMALMATGGGDIWTALR